MNALIVVDLQKDYFSGGELEIKDSENLIPIVNGLTRNKDFDLVILTKEEHPYNHVSFFTEHSGCNRYDSVLIDEKEFLLYPPHCIENQSGSQFHEQLDLNIPNMYIIKKGGCMYRHDLSLFEINLELKELLFGRGIKNVYICGILPEHSCKDVAVLCKQLGYNTFIIKDACKGISDDCSVIYDEFTQNGINVVEFKNVFK